MAQAAARSLWALIYVIINIAPIIQVIIQGISIYPSLTEDSIYPSLTKD